MKRIGGLPRRSPTKAGQSLFELVMAVGVIGLILLVLVSLSTLSVKNASYSRNQAEGARIGQVAVEWLRGERDKNWDNFVSNTTIPPSRCLKDLAWSSPKLTCSSSDMISNLYFRKVEFTPSDTNGDGNASNPRYDLIEAVITVYWTDGQGYHEIKNSTDFTDWRLQ